jgi:hypothetical protein
VLNQDEKAVTADHCLTPAALPASVQRLARSTLVIGVSYTFDGPALAN